VSTSTPAAITYRMSSVVAEILFEHKEQIPDGLYLQLMNTLKLINDTGNMPLTLTPDPVPTPVVNATPVVSKTFSEGIFKYKSYFISIKMLSATHLWLVQVDRHGELFGSNTSTLFEMKNYAAKTCFHANLDAIEYVILAKNRLILATDLVPM